MGKTKIKTVGEEVETSAQVDVRGDAEEGSRRLARSESSSEDGRRDTAAAGPRAKKEKKSEPKKRGQKYQEVRTKVDPTQTYSLIEAIKLASETSYSKFPGTMEAHLNTNVKNIRGLISLPHFAGKKLVILAFGTDADKSGADLVGTDEAISQIEAGKINFDVLVTTPSWMPKLAKAAKILGPKGLMPNPKNGTITENLSKAVAELQGGKVEFKTEKDGKVIHLSVGKVNQTPEEVAVNIKTLFNTIGKSKISKITLSATMGVGVRVDLTSI